MSPVAGVSHDYTIATVGGSALGFMLPRQNGKRPYSIRDARSLTPRQMTDAELTEAQFPTEYAQFVSQSDWRGGMGGVTYRSNTLEAMQLAAGLKVDGTVKGKLQVARELKSTTVDSNPTNYKPSGFAVVGTEVWAFVGRNVYTWLYGNPGSWVVGTTPTASDFVYRNGVEYGGRTFVPAWVPGAAVADSPYNYLYKADADADWTVQTAGASLHIVGAKFFAKSLNSAGAELFWCAYIKRLDGTFGTNIIASTTNPVSAAAWSTEVSIGDSTYPITGLLGSDDGVLILKPDGIYAYYADGTQENLTPDFQKLIHGDNFKGAIRWRDRVLLPIGSGGMYELLNGEIRDISLKLSMPELTQYHGRVVAIHGEPNFVYILVHDSTNLKYHLFKGELLSIEGVTDYRWHHQGSVTYTTGTLPDHAALFFESVPSGTNVHRRCWVGVESTGSNLLPYFLPQATDTEDGFTNDTDGLMQFVAYDKNMRNVNATWAKIDVESRNLGAGGRLFTFEYRLDAGSWLTTLADAAGNADGVVDVSPTQTMTFPSGTTGKVLELRATPALTSVGATSPELWDLRVTYNIRPATLKVLPIQAYLANDQVLLNGSRGGRSKLDLAQWETWDAQAAEVTVVDPRGTSRTMVFLPGAMRVVESAREITKRPEYIVSTLLAEV